MLCTRTHEADKALINLTMRRFSSLGHRLRGAALLRRETFYEAVGNTPLIKLQGPSAATGCDIYGKCEFMNPAGSVKDRAALNIFREAEAAGKLQRGGVIVEGTAGNTGIGLAAVAATRARGRTEANPPFCSNCEMASAPIMGPMLAYMVSILHQTST